MYTYRTYAGLLLPLWLWSTLASAGSPDTAGGRQARAQLDATVQDHVTALQQAGDATAAGIRGSVSAQQQRQQEKLDLQLRISTLRSEMGAEADMARRQALARQIQQLETRRGRL